MSEKSDDLLISISTDVATLRRSLKKMESAIGQSTDVAAKKFDRLGSQIDQSMSKSLGKAGAAVNRIGNVAGAAAARIAGVFAAGASLQAASRLADAAKNIQNALKVAGLEGAALTAVYDKLFASAQKNAAPIESLVTLYSRLALTQKELGASQQEILTFSDRVSLALRVGGTSAQEASGALLQLSQALGGGVVRAEEFNSVLEGAPTITQAVAAGLDEAGGSVAKLRKLVVDGKVSSQAFFRAFLEGSKTLDDKVAGAATTTAQQFVRLQNILQDTAGKIDTATGASDKFGKGLEDLAATIEQFGKVVVNASESELGGFVGWLSEGVDKAAEFKRLMGGIPGIIDKMGKLNQDLLNGRPLGTGLSEDAIQNRVDQAFDYLLTDAASYDADGVLLKVGRKVTLADTVPLAVTTRGHAFVGEIWQKHLVQHADRHGVDMLLAGLGDILARLAQDGAVRATMADVNQVEVIISAWSPTLGGVHRRFVTDGPDAFRIETPDQMFYGGPVDTDPTALVSPFNDGETMDGWLRRVGLKMFDAFRRQHGRTVATGELADYHAIGGHLDLTTVCADFSRIETIHTWPDVVGEKIDPERMAA